MSAHILGASVTLTEQEISNLTQMPILIIYGDSIELSSRWTDERNATLNIAARVEAAGGDVTFVDLPAEGIHGNSHMLSPRASHTAVWTDSEMIVWGGSDTFGTYFNTGGRYDPTTDTWTATTTTDAPHERDLHRAIWTGTQMIVWGGSGRFPFPTYFNTGGRYCAAEVVRTVAGELGAAQ